MKCRLKWETDRHTISLRILFWQLGNTRFFFIFITFLNSHLFWGEGKMLIAEEKNYPTDPFTIMRLRNPSYYVPELNEVRRSPDPKALKLWKGRSGSSMTCFVIHTLHPGCFFQWFPILYPVLQNAILLLPLLLQCRSTREAWRFWNTLSHIITSGIACNVCLWALSCVQGVKWEFVFRRHYGWHAEPLMG